MYACVCVCVRVCVCVCVCVCMRAMVCGCARRVSMPMPGRPPQCVLTPRTRVGTEGATQSGGRQGGNGWVGGGLVAVTKKGLCARGPIVCVGVRKNGSVYVCVFAHARPPTAVRTDCPHWGLQWVGRGGVTQSGGI